jgi:hypothetical protein
MAILNRPFKIPPSLMRTLKTCWRYCLLLPVCWSFSTAGYGQSIPIVRLGPGPTGRTNAPFDRSFYVWLPVDTTLQMDEIDELNLNRMYKKGSMPPFDTIATWLGSELLDTAFIDSVKIARKKYLQVLINQQLLPNTRFSVVLFIRASHEYLGELNQINQQLHEGDLFDAEPAYNTLRNSITVKNAKEPLPIHWPAFTAYQAFYQKSLATDYDTVNMDDPRIGTHLLAIAQAIDSSGFQLKNLFSCNCEKDFVAHELFADSSRFIIPLFNLLHIQIMLPTMASGQVNFEEFHHHEQLARQDIQKRLANLKLLEDGINNISYFFHLSSFADNVTQHYRSSIFDNTQLAIQYIDALMKALTRVSSDIRKQIAANRSIVSGEISFGGTLPSGQDLTTSSGNYFIADFGLVYAGTIVNNQYASLVRPYLGVNVSFLPIDKSQPLSAIQHKRFLHHLSFVMGLTTTALSRQGTYDLIKNMSVVTGLAFRLSRSFRATAGVLIYRRDNSNPDLAQPVTVGPLVSISLDLEVAKWFGDLKGKLF